MVVAASCSELGFKSKMKGHDNNNINGNRFYNKTMVPNTQEKVSFLKNMTISTPQWE